MDFENPCKRSVVDSIFAGNREKFRSNVEKAMEETKKGGYQAGTRGFANYVVGQGEVRRLNAEEYGELQKEIKKMTKTIKGEAGQKSEPITSTSKKPTQPRPIPLEPDIRPTSRPKEESKRIMSKGAERHEDEELERSGGVDPNDI